MDIREWEIWHDGESLGMVYAATEAGAYRIARATWSLEGLEVYPL